MAVISLFNTQRMKMGDIFPSPSQGEGRVRVDRPESMTSHFTKDCPPGSWHPTPNTLHSPRSQKICPNWGVIRARFLHKGWSAAAGSFVPTGTFRPAHPRPPRRWTGDAIV